jgi:hypothetical protein
MARAVRFPIRTPKRFASLTRPIPVANSELRRPVSAASCASRLTAAEHTLIDEFIDGMRSDSCELAAASELRTAFFDCSKSGSRSTVLSRECLLVFSDVPYWRPPAPRSVWLST